MFLVFGQSPQFVFQGPNLFAQKLLFTIREHRLFQIRLVAQQLVRPLRFVRDPGHEPFDRDLEFLAVPVQRDGPQNVAHVIRDDPQVQAVYFGSGKTFEKQDAP